MTNAFRARADELGTARSAGRFRSRTSLAEGPELNRVVAQAVARAKQGDREALRFLYVRYADNVYGYVAQHRARRATRPRTSRSTSSPS